MQAAVLVTTPTLSLRDAIESFAERQPGLASIEVFYDDCVRLVRRDPLNAGFYAMLALLAKSFTDRYEDEPLTANVAQDVKDMLIGQAERVIPALGLNSDAKLALLNDLAHALVAR